MAISSDSSVRPTAAAGDRAPGWALRAAILAALGCSVYYSLSNDVFDPLLATIHQQRWSAILVRPTLLWTVMASMLLVVRTLLWFGYRAAEPASFADAPMLTVIIPAYNEGEMVRRSIDSVAGALYPRGRLEVLVVDDGSTDDTWAHIQAEAERLAHVVTALRLPENRGKRHALAEGYRRARGDVVVTLDSDSVIEQGALLSLLGPFRDPRVGAVAGKVSVLNRNEGLIPRMLAMRFVLTFDLMRAAQSTYGSVYCCPGALTAYRADLVRNVLDEWLAQRFLGAQCTYGEDRAMTNAIFAQGFDTAYQRTAVVHTLVPTTYSKLCKMLLRWDRSYVREEIRYLGVLARRPPKAFVLSLIDVIVNNVRYPVAWASLALLVALLPAHPFMLIRLVVAIGVFAAFNMLYCLHSERSAEILFGILYAYLSFFGLFWIFPYAVVSVRARGWLTR